jgi:predicted DNA-binding protein (MmcQ/YjbR family)
MSPEALRSYFLAFPEVSEETPFDAVTAVYKTAGKMFALIDWNEKPLRCNLKCDADRAQRLRDQYSFVLPGYHMNKRYWNTVIFEDSLSDVLLLEWVRHSFEEVVSKMPKAQRERLMAAVPQAVVPCEVPDVELRESLRKKI